MKKAFAVVALLLVVFSSGCTVPGLDIEIPGIPDLFGGMNVQEQRNDIITIDLLDAIPSATVRSGQSIRLRAVAKDLQKSEYSAIDDVEIALYNTCGMFSVRENRAAERHRPTGTRQTTRTATASAKSRCIHSRRRWLNGN